MSSTTTHNLQTFRERYLGLLDPIDIELLVMHATGKSREFLLAHPEYILSEQEYTQAISYLDRRTNHEPIAYITGQKEFYGRNFFVNQHTLIPRPETELLIDEVLEDMGKESKLRDGEETRQSLIMDIGTGSGNIIITLAKELLTQSKVATYFGLDISAEALAVAQKNAKQLSIENQITFLQSNLLEHFPKSIFAKHSEIILLANLPYLSEEIYRSAEPDVRDFEPSTALVSDENGLAHYRQLFEHITELQRKKVFLQHTSLSIIIEISPEKNELIKKMIYSFFPKANIDIIKDYSNRFRFVKIHLSLS